MPPFQGSNDDAVRFNTGGIQRITWRSTVRLHRRHLCHLMLNGFGQPPASIAVTCSI
jgi:hypothetical protein